MPGMDSAKTIRSIPELIQAAGSLTVAARLLDMSPQAMVGARARGTLPLRRMPFHRARIESAGFVPADSLWTFDVGASREDLAAASRKPIARRTCS